MYLRQGCVTGLALAVLAGCGGSGSPVSTAGTVPASTDCTGTCFTTPKALTVSDVETIIAQGVAEAQARNVNATIAVVDRVGNVLAVYRMGAIQPVLISSSVNAAGKPLLHTGLDGIRLPVPESVLTGLHLENTPIGMLFAGAHLDDQAAIAKAVTGAYLSSEGNAFSTRTASQIIQEHFNVGDLNQASGPLFGVQFSQLACSDFIGSATATASAPTVGPQRSPLGLSADPGGFPLYKAGVTVGGVGVIADGLYSLDKDITDTSGPDNDEAIAYAASYSYAAPVDRRADEIAVNGVTLRFSNVDATGLLSNPPAAPAYSSLGTVGQLVKVQGYADGAVHAGTAYGQPASGVRADSSGIYPGQHAYVFVDAADQPRYPPTAGTAPAGTALTVPEVTQILSSALGVAADARAQIRLPVGLSAQVTIAVVDTEGNILGMVRSPDAPLFGSDVSVQKARAAALFSSSTAGAFLTGLPSATYLNTDANGYPILDPAPAILGNLFQPAILIGGYVTAAQTFLSLRSALTDGGVAYSDRAIGNLARPFYPDGIQGNPHGPFSKPYAEWSIFSTGLQLDLANNAILQHVLYVAGALGTDVPPGSCGGVDLSPPITVTHAPPSNRLANGLQIFPGSVPIYRGATLVGAIGVSGDGVDQDDMVAFLGLERAIGALHGSLSQAPAVNRADTLVPMGTRLQYVQCPQSPFINSNQENACAGF